MWTCPEALTAMLSASADTTSGTSQIDHGVGIAERVVERFELAAEVLHDFLRDRTPAAASLLQKAPGAISGVPRLDHELGH